MTTKGPADLSTGIASSAFARKPQVVLLYTRDRGFDGLLGEALSGTGCIVLIARTVADALQIVCQRGRELAFALMDFDGGCRGMTILSAIHTCFEELPILVTTSKDAEHVSAVAYANGARTCLARPKHSAGLANAISKITAPERQLAAA
jgi:CheY-like chemotaxis protein